MAGWATTGSTTAPSAKTNLDYFSGQTGCRRWRRHPAAELRRLHQLPRGVAPPRTLRVMAGWSNLPFWRQGRRASGLRRVLAGPGAGQGDGRVPLKVPTMWLQGLWDQEDMWGAIHCYEAVEPKDTANDMNYLVMGPWRHSQVNYEAFAWPVELERRHGDPVPPRCAAAVLQSISERQAPRSRTRRPYSSTTWAWIAGIDPRFFRPVAKRDARSRLRLCT